MAAWTRRGFLAGMALGAGRAWADAGDGSWFGSLRLSCAHVVIQPDLIRGVLRVWNPGPEPVAIADRWNSWGAYQWGFRFGDRLARNPVDTWDENRYTETVLAPTEVRAVFFSIEASTACVAGAGWPFVVRPWAWDESDRRPAPVFTPATPVELRWNADAADRRPSSWSGPRARRATGAARAHSVRVEQLDDLLPRLRGADDRRLPGLP